MKKPIARVVEIGAAERDRVWDGLKLVAGTQNESGSLGGAMRPGRTMRTPEFTLKHGRAFALVKGSGMIYAGVAQHIMLAGPLHGSLVQKFNTTVLPRNCDSRTLAPSTSVSSKSGAKRLRPA